MLQEAGYCQTDPCRRPPVLTHGQSDAAHLRGWGQAQHSMAVAECGPHDIAVGTLASFLDGVSMLERLLTGPQRQLC